jgi:hypothetical protein
MNAKCKLCGGWLMLLGVLGSLRHYRCRNCGMMFARRCGRRSARAWS